MTDQTGAPEAPNVADALVELEAMKALHATLLPLPPSARARVMNWAAGVFALPSSVLPQAAARAPTNTATDKASDVRADTGRETSYNHFADLLGDSNAQTDAERALVGGYWFQVIGGTDDFTSQAVNDKLKDTGQPISNITRAMDTLKSKSPQLIRQLQKTGKSQQSRKLFKLTTAGVQAVERMLKDEG
jgi:hypothetical protein